MNELFTRLARTIEELKALPPADFTDSDFERLRRTERIMEAIKTDLGRWRGSISDETLTMIERLD